MGRTLAIEVPSLAEYERALPDGWGSFPHCQGKSALVRGLAIDPFVPRDALPEPLRELLDDPPPLTAWVPEVHIVGLLLAVHHEHARNGDAGAFLAWMEERNRELIGSGTYAPMLRATASEKLLKHIVAGWERLHRGSELALRSEELQGEAEHGASLVLTAPPGLYPSLAGHIHGIGFRVALESAGRRDVRVRHVVHRPGHTEYHLAWLTESTD